jgi:hypothetical protein
MLLIKNLKSPSGSVHKGIGEVEKQIHKNRKAITKEAITLIYQLKAKL